MKKEDILLSFLFKKHGFSLAVVGVKLFIISFMLIVPIVALFAITPSFVGDNESAKLEGIDSEFYQKIITVYQDVALEYLNEKEIVVPLNYAIALDMIVYNNDFSKISKSEIRKNIDMLIKSEEQTVTYEETVIKERPITTTTTVNATNEIVGYNESCPTGAEKVYYWITDTYRCRKDVKPSKPDWWIGKYEWSDLIYTPIYEYRCSEGVLIGSKCEITKTETEYYEVTETKTETITVWLNKTAEEKEAAIRKRHPNLFDPEKTNPARLADTNMGYFLTLTKTIGGLVFHDENYGESSGTYDSLTANAKKIWDFLIGKGWTKEAVAGVLGNFQLESSLNPEAENPSSKAYGLAQWLGGRREKLEAYAKEKNKPVNDINLQLEYLYHEITTDPYEKEQLGNYHTISNVDTATEEWYNRFERGGMSQEYFTKRKEYANFWYSYFTVEGKFIVPMEKSANPRVTVGWGLYDPFDDGNIKFHQAVDWAGKSGAKILASANGRVTKVVSHCSVGDHSCGNGFGNQVIITHTVDGKQYQTVYSHFQSVSVSVGDNVIQGQPIGIQGNTGASNGAHVHFELHSPEFNYRQSTQTPAATAIDPLSIIKTQ